MYSTYIVPAHVHVHYRDSLHYSTHSSCSPRHWGHSMHGRVPPSIWDYNYFVVCCHPDPLLHPPDTTTLLLARYFLIKIWLPGNRLQMEILYTVHYFI